MLDAEKKGEQTPAGEAGLERKNPTGVAAIDQEQAVNRDEGITFGQGINLHFPAKGGKFHLGLAIKGAAGLGWKGADFEERWVKACLGRDYNTLAQLSPETITKATLEVDDDSLGGFLVPEETSTEIMAPLKAKAVFRAAGATILSDAPQTLNLPTQNGSTTVYVVGMGAQTSAITESEPTFGNKRLDLKRYAARSKIDEDLLLSSPFAVEAIVRKDIVEQMALKEDADCWNGSSIGIKGILYDASLTNTYSAIGALSLMTHVKGALDTMSARNAGGNLTAMVMHPTTYGYITNKVDGIDRALMFNDYTGRYSPRNVFGYPVFTSTQVTNGYILVGNFSEFFIADGGALRIKVLREAYADMLQIGIVAVHKVDALARQISEFELLSGITS
jgi:HK97 family phage major capsid protein